MAARQLRSPAKRAADWIPRALPSNEVSASARPPIRTVGGTLPATAALGDGRDGHIRERRRDPFDVTAACKTRLPCDAHIHKQEEKGGGSIHSARWPKGQRHRGTGVLARRRPCGPLRVETSMRRHMAQYPMISVARMSSTRGAVLM
ncbi:uncharacterized protein LOC125547717 [Triticum urartu]|uniref:uncharacterized protein LOC125547717 n=1 Tax=Triticum urartu TaxID=4572 RepID=UPI002044784C|nr:uncharacterized protein LOC125547717 [Triticum urartu]